MYMSYMSLYVGADARLPLSRPPSRAPSVCPET
jgi:hypothetical protein